MPGESFIWQIGLFKKNSNQECECQECNKTIKLTQGSTSGAINHLKSKHKGSEYEIKFAQLQNRRDGEKGTMNKQISIIGSGGLSSFDKKVIHWVACTQASFGDINSPTTHALFMSNNPLNQLKDESYYRKTVLVKVFHLVKAEVQKVLREMPKISFTTDTWTEGVNSFISLTAHGISPNFQRKNFILAVSEFEGTHSGERIGVKLRELVKSWSIESEKCFLFVRDGGRNFVKAFSDKKINPELWMDSDCAAHLLNLVVRDALNTSKIVQDLLAKGRRIVGHYKHSPLASGLLKVIQKNLGLPLHHLLQDVPTRWNASYLMLRRLSEQELAVNKYALDNKKFDLTFDEQECQILREMVKLLEPMEELTRLYCCQDAPISVKFPYAKMAEQNLLQMITENAEVSSLKTQIINGLRTRFGDFNFDKTHSTAQFLDPRFKDKFATFPEQNDIISWLDVREIDDFLQPEFEVVDLPIKSPSAKRPLLSFFDETLAVGTSNDALTQPDLAKEVSNYLSLPRAPVQTDPMEFWRENCKNFPKLSKEAMKFLSAPATSVASEQLSSTARDTYDYRRSRLRPRKAEMLIFLNRNLPLLKFQY